MPGDDAIRASAEAGLHAPRETGGSGLLQEVFRYADAAASRAALEEYADRVRRCPSAHYPHESDGHRTRFETVQSVPGERLLVARESCTPNCTGLYVAYWLVARSGDGLTTAAYGIVEDGDPRDSATKLLSALAEQLSAAVAAG